MAGPELRRTTRDFTLPRMLNRPAPLPDPPMELLVGADWQMSFGERAAMEGVLTQLQPELSIELGTAGGGSLAAIVGHSREVHSFDLEEPGPLASRFSDVQFHTGDSHVLLPQVLAELADQGRNVDFVLVDGDHSADGVQQDVEDLLASPAIGQTIIVLHDTSNERVREGLERVRYEGRPKVAYVDLDFLGGYVLSEPGKDHELWGGLGLIWVSATRSAYFRSGVRQDRYLPAAEILRLGLQSRLAHSYG